MKPTLTVKNFGGTQGNLLSVANDVQAQMATFFSRDTVNSTFNYVENSAYLTTSQRYLLGVLGASNAEVLTVNSVTAPTNAVPSAVTFSSVPVNRHGRGEPLSLISWDQVEISSASSISGSYAVLATNNLQVNSQVTLYQHAAGVSTDFYKIRFKNSATGFFSQYSDPISPSSFVSGTVGYFLQSIKDTLGIKEDNTTITNEFLLDTLNEARRILDREYMTGLMKEWRQQFEYPIKMLAGCNYITLPTNIDYSQTNRAVLAARYSSNSAGSSMPLRYVDKKDWNFATLQRRYTQATSSVLIGATSIVLDNTGDFPAAGSVQFQAENYSQNIMTVSYTANDKNTNTLSGVTGVTRTIAAGSQAWAYQTQAYPTLYTVIDGKLYLDSVVPQALNGINLFIDYYKAYVDLTSMTDVFPEHYYDIYKNYLRFAIKRRRDDTIGEEDPDYKRWLTACKSTFQTDYIGQTLRIK